MAHESLDNIRGHPDRRDAGGFTLAEAMIATLVLAIAAAGVLLPFTSGAVVRTEGSRSTLAAKLASELMERVVSTDPDVIVANYNYSEAEGEVKDASGSVITDPAYSRFSRQVSCEEKYVGQQIDGAWKKFVLVTVTVSYAGREVVTLRRLVSK